MYYFKAKEAKGEKDNDDDDVDVEENGAKERRERHDIKIGRLPFACCSSGSSQWGCEIKVQFHARARPTRERERGGGSLNLETAVEWIFVDRSRLSLSSPSDS